MLANMALFENDKKTPTNHKYLQRQSTSLPICVIVLLWTQLRSQLGHTYDEQYTSVSKRRDNVTEKKRYLPSCVLTLQNIY